MLHTMNILEIYLKYLILSNLSAVCVCLQNPPSRSFGLSSVAHSKLQQNSLSGEPIQKLTIYTFLLTCMNYLHNILMLLTIIFYL